MSELAISASTDLVCCAARAPDGSLTTRAAERGDLAVAVAEVCEIAGLRADRLQRLIVDVGPGSYTGLRVAVTFARMLAAFGSLPLFEFTSFELHALMALRADPDAGRSALRVVLDARRARFHTGLLRFAADPADRTGRIEVVEAPHAVDAEALLASIDGSQCVVADPRIEAALQERCAVVGAQLVLTRAFDPAELFAAELAPRPIEPERIEPLYLMGSYAEQP